MSENPCEHLIEEAEQALYEYVLLWNRARRSLSLSPINKEKESIVNTPEQDEAKQKANEAKERWLKANEAMVDCITKLN